MPIRVIAGSAKGLRLQRVPGDSTRPIMDRVKEALFSIIGRDIIGLTWLDLFAGTGSVGIEALSRGAARAVFVELDRRAVQTIQTNLQVTRLTEKAIIFKTDVFAFLKKKPAEPYHYIYVAPPQYKGLWLATLQALDGNPLWIADSTTVIVQIDPQEWEQSPVFAHLAITDERRYGKTKLIFFSRPSPAAESLSSQEQADG